MVAYRRQNCVGLFLSVWIFLLECEAWCRVSVVCDTIVGLALRGTHHLNGCFRGARVKISRRIFLEINVEKIDQRTKMNCKHMSLRLQNFDLIRKMEAKNNSDYKYHLKPGST